MFCSDIGIDLGTSSVLIYIKEEGIVLNEPSVVAIKKDTNKIIEIGEKAKNMIGKTPPDINIIRPLKDGVISNYTYTEAMLKHFIKKAIGKQSSKRPRIAICVPSQITEVERKAVKDATKDSGAREVFIVEEPVAAAIGSGIDVSRACGSMIIDIGAGTTDIAVISLGDSVVKSTIKVAGDYFNSEIIKYIKKKYNLLIGEKTAELIKINIGTVFEDTSIVEMEIKGQNTISLLPASLKVTSYDICNALKESMQRILEEIIVVLEKTPPELSSDIYERGIVLTGGGALLYGIDRLIKEKTNINTVLAQNSLECVCIGTGKYIDYYKNSFINKKRFKFFKKF